MAQKQKTFYERHINDSPVGEPGLCLRCARLMGAGRCEAFPNGIPEEVRLEYFNHRNPHPLDNGLQFVEGRSPHIHYTDQK